MGGDTEIDTPLLNHCFSLLHAVSDVELQRELVTLSKEAYQLILVTHRLIAVDEEGRRPGERDDSERIGETQLLCLELSCCRLPSPMPQEDSRSYGNSDADK